MSDSNRKADKSVDSEELTQRHAYTIVGVGASAGGLEAFSELLEHTPPDLNMALVLVQHLDPHHVSVLTNLLAGHSKMPVREVTEGTVVSPNHVYVIPPNTTMTISNGVLNLGPRPEQGGRYMPIDAFLCSLAEDQESNAIGVVLSGAASDGTLGLKAIKGAGGITFTQDESAKFDGMPTSAVNAGVVDFVLPPAEIARELTAFARNQRSKSSETLEQRAPVFQRILRLLRTTLRLDLTQYKQATIRRRIERRIFLTQSENAERYLALLEKDSKELRALAEDLLINVTEFFRDPAVFESLKSNAFPELTKERESGKPIRIWVPACSTGEEVYSIAICLTEYLNTQGLDFPIHIFGTDIGATSIDKARAGIYSQNAVSVISAERQARFFTKIDSGYQINRSIREKCVFALQNVATDPPFSRMDLISCRNLLIYLGPALQHRVMNTFFYALQPDGCLLLGSAETPGSLSELFEPISKDQRIFRKKSTVLRAGFELPARVAEVPVFKEESSRGALRTQRLEESSFGAVQKQVDRMLLSQYAPGGVIVNDSFRIVEFRGEVSPYLAPGAGEADLDLFRMIREDLSLHLGAAIEEAKEKNSGIRLEGLHVARQGHMEIVNVAVTPISVPGMERFYAIMFEDAGDPTPAIVNEGEPTEGKDGSERARLKQLETELASTRRYMQSIIEEMRSANEEAQSSNEELQSANEELQTAKEELQAANEELHIVNDEMQSRNMELRQVSDDLSNLLSSLQVPILMLDNDLHIRAFTHASEKLLNLIPTDIGRPISDLRPRIEIPDLEGILRRVIDSLAPYEKELRAQDGQWFSLRVRPYRTVDNRISGVVLQLVDIDQLKRSVESLRLARDYATAITQTVREPLVVLDSESRIKTVNRAYLNVFKTTEQETLGRSLFEVDDKQFDIPEVHRLLDNSNRLSEVEIDREFTHIGRRTMSLTARQVEQDGDQELILLALDDITERKLTAEARFRRLFEAAKDGIIIADAENGVISDVNPYVETMFGYRRDDMIGKNLWDIEPLSEFPDVKAAIERISSKDSVRFDDLLLRSRSGRRVHVEVVANAYYEQDRRVIQFNVRDITERKRFDRKLQHTQKLESLGLLAGGIAHDFNNLLTGILGYASLCLLELPATAPTRKYLREIVNASQRAADLTRQMLAYAGKGRNVVDVIDISNLVREITPLIHTSIPKLVEIQQELAPDPPLFEADPAQIQQLVMNLIINAAEAIGEDKPGVVVVKTGERVLDEEEIKRYFPNDELAPGRYVSLEVGDTGAGMDEATKARIFDPFFTTKFQGRGLGLAAVAGIVRTQRGSIHVESSPGMGTHFTVLLPVANQEIERQEREELRGEAVPPGFVLFIDDEESLRGMGQAVLARYGHRVLVAKNGVEGVQLFREHKDEIDVVILDMMMPIMGGEETLDHLKEIRKDVPVVVSTGYGESEAMRRFEGKETAGFLQKPYTVAQLVDTVETVLGRI